MIKQRTLLQSLYIAGGMVILALTGIFGSFSALSVVNNVLTMSTVLLVFVLAGMGYYIAAKERESGFAPMVVNALVAGVIMAGVLALLTLLVYTPEPRVRPWIAFTFPNLSVSMHTILTFGMGTIPGLLALLALGVGLGAGASLLFALPDIFRRALLSAVSLSIVLGLLQSQLTRIMPLPDALLLALMFLPAYGLALAMPNLNLPVRVGASVVLGAAVGVIGAFLAGSGVINVAATSLILTRTPLWLWLLAVGAVFGVFGVLAGSNRGAVNSGILYVMVSLVLVGVMNWQRGMTLTAFIITLGVLFAVSWFAPTFTRRSNETFAAMPSRQQMLSTRTIFVIAILIAFLAPSFLGRSLTFALALVGLYIIMGIGLNIVVGYSGLLDLGHVGFFAIGAYTIGLLTSPTIITCGVPASAVLVRDVAQVREAQALDIAQESGNATFVLNPETSLLEPLTCNTWNFWMALPVAVFLAGAAGVILGIPVLRLRGDYLAIVTLGLSEIISIIIGASSYKDIFGSAQGISPIPSPTIDLTFLNPSWNMVFFSANIYYLVIPSILLAAFISQRLVHSRVGRAWRAMRADEDVAEAMGIDLVGAKLSAFGISAAFAGLGGAFFGAGLQGAFPNSFTLLVSINVLAMIIIGGLGSVPGVIVGALMLIGLPEILRELADYRLLVFGMLLVGTMLLKPEGLVPPSTPRIAGDGDENDSSAVPQPAAGD